MKKIFGFIIAIFVCISVYGQSGFNVKESRIFVQDMSKALIDYENTSKNDILLIKYQSYIREGYEIITNADLYYVKNKNEMFLGKFSVSDGFRNAVGELIYQPSKWFGRCEVLGISMNFLQDPTMPSGIAISTSGNLYESEIMFRLGFVFATKTIYRWFPKWDDD